MLEDGQIAEIGTHKELVGRDGAYADLYQASRNESRTENSN
jgi:ABC-type multidrug transport system fused ATPase/permease subunit